MNIRRRPYPALVALALSLSCQSQPATLPPADADPGRTADLALGDEVAAAAGAEVGPAEGGPGEDGLPSDGPGLCHWQRDDGRYGLPHFRFLLTTPDGHPQTAPQLGVDAGYPPWTIKDFEGRFSQGEGNQFTVDSCLAAPASCEPTLYRFAVCTESNLSCRPDSAATPGPVSIPEGRRVRVVWDLVNDVPSFSPGLYWLGIYDAEPTPAKGSILFLGSGSYQPAASANGPWRDLPFSVSLRALGCGGRARDASIYVGDDYAFVFASLQAPAATLQVGTGESGRFTFEPPSGLSQTLEIHCLDAVQPSHSDDYWNWDFWAAGQAVALPDTPTN